MDSSIFRLSRFIVIAMMLSAGLAAPTPASAAPGDLICTTNFQFNFTPALTPTNTTATADGTAGFVNCISLNGNFSHLQSATVRTIHASATSTPGIPCSLVLNTTGTALITWSPGGQTSLLDFTVSTTPPNVTISAEIVAGVMAGNTITAVPAEGNPNLDCALVGLKSITSVVAELLIQ